MSSFFVRFKASKQGASKGESQLKERRDWIAGLGFSSDLTSPRDAASGQASGKRHYSPIRFTKEWGAASPQIMTALARNETLDSVWFEFVKADQTGRERVFETLHLTNASFVGQRRYIDVSAAPEKGAPRMLEEVAVTFQKIEFEDKDGKTAFSDDWAVLDV